jgi:hypothetical protein
VLTFAGMKLSLVPSTLISVIFFAISIVLTRVCGGREREG